MAESRKAKVLINVEDKEKDEFITYRFLMSMYNLYHLKDAEYICFITVDTGTRLVNWRDIIR